MSQRTSTLTFRIAYLDNGDVVAEEESREAAVRRLGAFLEEHPELSDEIGIQPVDAHGFPVQDLMVGPLMREELAHH